MEADITEYRDVNPPGRFATPNRVRTVRSWAHEQAEHRYALYVDKRLPVGSADGWKESASPYGKRDVGTSRPRNVLRWVQNEALKTGYSEAISQKKAHLRKRWHLDVYREIHPKKRWKSKIVYPEPKNGKPEDGGAEQEEPEYTGMFTS